MSDRYEGFPAGFFDRSDPSPDARFYGPPRLVTHIDAGAIAAVGALYAELGLCGATSGPILDLMSSWISHFPSKPSLLTILGMNEAELAANAMADERVTFDLNTDPSPVLPFDPGAFAGVVCCVSVDYLARPIELFDEVSRVLRPGGLFVCTFSNRCFPTKAIRGWLATDDDAHMALVAEYFRRSDGWSEPLTERRTPPGHRGDPLFAVWARRTE